jgi:taurine dioxygenase
MRYDARRRRNAIAAGLRRSAMANSIDSGAYAAAASNAADVYAHARIGVFPLSGALGAEIRGVDLSEPLSAVTLAAIHHAWLEHCVVLFRNQHLSDGDLVRFSRRFGDLDLGPTMAWRPGNQAYPEIFVISNVIENNEPIGFLGNGEADWHTDMSHSAMPPKASTLYSLEVPADGSAPTGFMNMYKVLDSLSPDLRSRIDGLRLKHDPAHTLQGELRDGYAPSDADDIESLPGPIHPLVRTHPESGRKALYLGRERNGVFPAARVLGVSRSESDALLAELWRIVRAERHIWYHQWQVGDYLMWDNRAVMHRRASFNQELRRVMHRTQIRDSVAPA